MRRVSVLAAVLATVLIAPAPALAKWSLGANLGLTVYDPTEPGSANVTMIGVPTGTSVFTSIRPGLRVGFTDEAMDHEPYLDLGFDQQSSGGESFRATRLGANYQYNFHEATVRPYVTAGAGIYGVHGPGVSSTSLTFGGGAGIGIPVSGGAGRLRVEGRYDHLGEGKQNGSVVIDEAHVIQLSFGFDLWMR
jgi:lipid A 3-O-deacylase PagL